MDFSINDIQIGHDYTSKIKQLLTFTVLVEFFFSLVNPLTVLLKLYPIITFSRSDILLPWLITHALNTLLPKILSVSLALFFYSENAISTMSLIEFLIVETINFAIAGYNWYVFFEFYMDLREVDRQRFLQKSQIKVTEKLPDSHSSVSGLREIFRDNTLILTELEALRTARSLSSSLEGYSQDLDLIDTSIISFSIEENLSPAEKTMKLLKLTQTELNDARKNKHGSVVFNFDDNNVERRTKVLDYTSANENSVKSDHANTINTFQAHCYCSSSDDEEDEEILIVNSIKNKQSTKNRESRKGFSLKPDTHISSKMNQNRIMNKNPRNIRNNDKSTVNTIMFSPPISFTLNSKSDAVNDESDNLNLFLNKNFEFLDKMCRAKNFEFKSVLKNKQLKWSIFQAQLESNLDSTLLKKCDLKINNESENIKCLDVNKNNVDEVSKSIINEEIKEYHKESKLNNVDNLTELFSEDTQKSAIVTNKSIMENCMSTTTVKKDNLETDTSQIFNFNKISKYNSLQPERKSFRSHHTFTKNSLDDPLLNNSKHELLNISDLEPKKSIKLAKYIGQQNVRELLNLRTYNNLTLEQDKREILQKKKKSKMTGYKKSKAELAFHNSDAVKINVKAKIADRTCRSTHSREKINKEFNLNETKKHQNETWQPGMAHYELLNNRIYGTSSTINRSDNVQNYNINLDQFLTEEKVKTVYDGAINSINQISNSKGTYAKHSEILKESISKVETSTISTSLEVSKEKAEKSQQENNSCEPVQRITLKMREIIDQIDWSFDLNTAAYSSPPLNIKSHSIATAEEIPEERVIVDDDTVILLKNAFSFSDTSKRGFHLGPDFNEPYPIFQVVALTIAESFKASVYRNVMELSPAQLESEAELINPDQVIYCRLEENFQSGDNGTLNNVLLATNDLNNDVSEEIEQKKNISTYLVEQLQENLDSSREILSARKNVYHFAEMDENNVMCMNDVEKLSTANLLDYLSIGPPKLYNQNENVKTDFQTLKTYVCTIDGKNILNEDNSSSSKINENTSRSHISVNETISKVKSTGQNTNFNLSTSDNSLNRLDHEEIVSNKSRRLSTHQQSQETTSKGKEIRISEVCETKFENEIIMHKFRQGNGLSAGNVMKYDSEGRILSNPNSLTTVSSNSNYQEKNIKSVKSILQEDNSSVLQQKNLNNSNDNLVELFESFYGKFQKNYGNSEKNEKFKESLKRLANTEKFANFMSLLQIENFKFRPRKNNYDATNQSFSSDSQEISYYSANEIELNNSEFQHNESVPEHNIIYNIDENEKAVQKDSNEIFRSFPQNNENIIENSGKYTLDEIKKIENIKKDNNVIPIPISGENKNVHLTERNLNVTPPINRTNVIMSEELRKYKELLNSNDISQKIANWNSESTGSLYTIGSEKGRKIKNLNTDISFSDNSDIEEFLPDC